MIDDNFSHDYKTDSPPIVEPRVAILVAGGSEKLLTAMRQIAKDTGTEVTVDMPMPMDAGVISLDNFVAKRFLWPEKGVLKAATVATHQVNSRGKLVPIKTTVAAKFPLLSRRQRRAIQREISKAADKSTIK